MCVNLRTGLYEGKFIGGHSDTRNIAFIAINVAEVEGTKSKKSSVVFNMFAAEAFGSGTKGSEAFGSDSEAVEERNEPRSERVASDTEGVDGNCVVQGKSIICTVEKIENCPLEKINNKDCLCVVFKEKTRGISGNTYGSAIIQLNEQAGELTEGEYWTNGGTSGVITDLKLQDLKDERNKAG